MTESSASMAEAVEALRDSLTGDVLVEGDREYERARLCFNLLIDRRPAVIARSLDVDDVAEALAFGQARGLELQHAADHQIATRTRTSSVFLRPRSQDFKEREIIVLRHELSVLAGRHGCRS